MTGTNKDVAPSPKQVQEIFRDTYNFYTKWIVVKEPNWDEVLADSREIEARYPFELCRKILIELVDVIEKYYMERSNNDA